MAWQKDSVNIQSSHSRDLVDQVLTPGQSMNILLVGTAGHNLGDDALASVLVKNLERTFPGANVKVTSVNPGRLIALGLNEVCINRKSLTGWATLLKHIRQADLVLLGGGTLIQDALGISLLRGMLPYIWQITFLARLLGKPVATVPIGMDVLRHQRSTKIAQGILRRCQTVILRDQRSFELAADALAGDSTKLVLSADPVFSLENDSFAPVAATDDPYFVISYVKEKREDEAVVSELLSLIDAMRRKWPVHRLVLLSMDTRIEDELGIYQKILGKVAPGTVQVESPSDYRQAAAIIRNATAVVAMRLHAMIIALGHVPVVGISRTTKTDTLIAQAGIHGLSVEQTSAKRVVDLLDIALADTHRLASQRGFVKAADQRFRASMDTLARRMTGNTAEGRSSRP
ncbi:MAG: polysaccharide pyruvyl transferase family protein [Pseudomonas sp.]